MLRELIRNAHDSITRRAEPVEPVDERGQAAPPPRISIEVDPAARQIRIADNGRGLTDAEIEAALSTIGQFGIGLLSAFIVADRVSVVTKAAGHEALHWESHGAQGYTVRPGHRDDVGTTVVLHINPQHTRYLETARIKQIIRTCPDFNGVPISVNDDAVTAPLFEPLDASEAQRYAALEQAYAALFKDRTVTARVGRFEPVALPAVLADADDPLTLHLNAANPIIRRLVARSQLEDEVSRSALQSIYNNARILAATTLPADVVQTMCAQSSQAIDLMLGLDEKADSAAAGDADPEPPPAYLSCSVTLPEGEPRSEEIFGAVRRSVLEAGPYYWQVRRADSSPAGSDLPLDLDEPPARAVLHVAVFAGPRLNQGLVNEVSIGQILGLPQLILCDEGHPELPPSFADVPRHTVRGLGAVLRREVLSALAAHPEVGRDREHERYLSPSVLAWCAGLEESAGWAISARYATWPEFLKADSAEVASAAGIEVALVEAAKSGLRQLAGED